MKKKWTAVLLTAVLLLQSSVMNVSAGYVSESAAGGYAAAASAAGSETIADGSVIQNAAGEDSSSEAGTSVVSADSAADPLSGAGSSSVEAPAESASSGSADSAADPVSGTGSSSAEAPAESASSGSADSAADPVSGEGSSSIEAPAESASSGSTDPAADSASEAETSSGSTSDEDDVSQEIISEEEEELEETAEMDTVYDPMMFVSDEPLMGSKLTALFNTMEALVSAGYFEKETYATGTYPFYKYDLNRDKVMDFQIGYTGPTSGVTRILPGMEKVVKSRGKLALKTVNSAHVYFPCFVLKMSNYKSSVQESLDNAGKDYFRILYFAPSSNCVVITLNANGASTYQDSWNGTIRFGVPKGQSLANYFDIFQPYLEGNVDGNGLKKEGYRFIGYYDTAQGKITCYNLLYANTTFSRDTVLTAQWRKLVRLTYVANGGRIMQDDLWMGVTLVKDPVVEGEKIYFSQLESMFRRNGYEFIGVTYDQAGNNKVASAGTGDTLYYPVADKDEIWYAQWKTASGIRIINQPDLHDSSGEGQQVTISVYAVGQNLKYQWQRMDLSAFPKELYDMEPGTEEFYTLWGKTAKNISGATSETYSFTMKESDDLAVFACMITDSKGNRVMSNPTLASLFCGVVKDPEDYYAQPGQTAKFTVKASGHNKKYEWRAYESCHAGDENYRIDLTKITGVKGINTDTLLLPARADLLGETEVLCKVSYTYKRSSEAGITDEAGSEMSDSALLMMGEAVPSVALTLSPEPSFGKNLTDVTVTAKPGGNVSCDLVTDVDWYSTAADAESVKLLDLSKDWYFFHYFTDAEKVSSKFEMKYYCARMFITDKKLQKSFNANVSVTVNGRPVRADYVKTAGKTLCVLVPYDLTGYSAPVKPLWRFYSSKVKDHFYTMYDSEKQSLINNNSHYKYEGLGWLIETEKRSNNVTVYRFYNEKDKDHFYTISVAERDQLIAKYKAGTSHYRYENVGWYTPKKSNTPLYRFYSAAAKDHFYTTSAVEKADLEAKYKAGKTSYKYEGIAWYCAE